MSYDKFIAKAMASGQSTGSIKEPVALETLPPDQFRYIVMIRHDEMRNSYIERIDEARTEALARGVKEEDIVIAIFHVDEALITNKTRKSLLKDGLEMVLLNTTRTDLTNFVKDFVHPTSNTKCYEDLVDTMEEQDDGFFYVAVFCMQNATLVKLDKAGIDRTTARKKQVKAERAEKDKINLARLAEAQAKLAAEQS